jgi:Holliday junction resolvase RusA-like endonuclease
MKTTILTFNELPPTLNEIINVARRNRFASAKLKRDWGLKLTPAIKKLSKLKGEVYLECVWRVKNKNRDADNIAAALKFPLDVLVNCKVIKDDNIKVIKSPIIHHVEISNQEGFTLYLRDEEAFKKRLKEDISCPPANPISGIPTKSRSQRTK